ncbi:amidase [Shewanella sp.]|uniref:amidase n=1 Tax=Shewanella sp. TaxID=50422 RepID=UPI003A9782A1
MARDATVFCTQGPDGLAPTAAGVLSGFSFVFKDLFDVQGYVTGAGNPAWLQSHAPASDTAAIITRLLAQGARGVGRVQTDELAYSLNGQNIHYGTPCNPKAPDCIPGGSSSGSAVAVARGDADFAIGTDTGGSVRVPASYCGIYGLRPSLGKLPLAATFALASSFDTAGVFARQLPLLKRVYQSLTGEADVPVATRIGVLQSQLCDPYLARLERFVKKAQQQYIEVSTVADELNAAALAELSELFRTIQGFEIIQTHAPWLQQHLDSLDPAIAARVQWSQSITPAQYQAGLQQQAAFKATFIALLRRCGGLIVLPTTPGAPPRLDTPAEVLAEYRSCLMGLTALAGLAGCPQLHIPLLDGTQQPYGVSLLGVPDSEMTLLNTALALVGEGESL